MNIQIFFLSNHTCQGISVNKTPCYLMDVFKFFVMELNTTRQGPLYKVSCTGSQLYKFEDPVNSGSLAYRGLEVRPETPYFLVRLTKSQDRLHIDFTRSLSKEVVILTMYWTYALEANVNIPANSSSKLFSYSKLFFCLNAFLLPCLLVSYITLLSDFPAWVS